MRSVESRMANMAVVCACIVALSHVGYNTDVGSAGWWLVRMTRYGFCCLAVPFFFMVSGYFLARHFGEAGWWARETGKRMQSLLVPYLLWCVAFFLFARIGATAVKASSWACFMTALRFPIAKLPLALGLRLDAPPMLVPLWYMRALFVIVLLSPVFAWFAREWRRAWLLLAALATLYVVFSPHRNGLVSTKVEHFLYYGISLMGMFYFYLGVMMRKTRFLEKTLGVSPWAGAAFLVAGVVAVAWRTGGIASSGDEPFPVLCAAIPFLVSGMWLLLPASPWPTWLTSMSFPIYALHFFAVYAIDGFRVCKEDKSIGLMVVHVVCAVLIPCICALVVRRLPHVAVKFLFGGR